MEQPNSEIRKNFRNGDQNWKVQFNLLRTKAYVYSKNRTNLLCFPLESTFFAFHLISFQNIQVETYLDARQAKCFANYTSEMHYIKSSLQNEEEAGYYDPKELQKEHSSLCQDAILKVRLICCTFGQLR